MSIIGRFMDLPLHQWIPVTISCLLIAFVLAGLWRRRRFGDWVLDLTDHLVETVKTWTGFRRIRDDGPYDPSRRWLDPRWQEQNEADFAAQRAAGFRAARTSTGSWATVPVAGDGDS